jgi:hypothetical protein
VILNDIKVRKKEAGNGGLNSERIVQRKQWYDTTQTVLKIEKTNGQRESDSLFSLVHSLIVQ